jgi:hypothetical protein
MLLRMFNPRKTSSDAFSQFSLSNFTQYFLVPYVAHNLIAEDLRQSPKRAFDKMLESSNAGESLHPEVDDDDELEGILEANIQAALNEHRAVETSNRDPGVPGQQKSSKVCKVPVLVSLNALTFFKAKGYFETTWFNAATCSQTTAACHLQTTDYSAGRRRRRGN